MANIKIDYSKASEKFLNKNSNIITEDKTDELIIKSIKNILYKGDENIDLKRLVNYKPNHYRIRTGKVRIIFTLINGIVTVVSVKDIDFRGNVYKR